MENQRTDGNGENKTPTITELDNRSAITDIPFDISELVKNSSKDTFNEVDDKDAKPEQVDENKKDSIVEENNSIELEGKNFTLDENGNALNEDGTVFKTKEELEKLQLSDEENNSQDQEDGIVQSIIKRNGVEILDENGRVKSYEDTEEGLAEYNEDYARYNVEQSQIELFKAYPQAKELIKHLAQGGTENDFYRAKSASWKNYTLDEENESQISEVIIQDLLAKGHSKEEAEELVTMYKDSKKLVEKGKIALESRIKDEAIKEKANEELEKKKKIEYEKIVEEHWNRTADIIKKGNLKNIIIPESDKRPFNDYISIAVDEHGNSQADLDEKQSDIETNLELQYLRFKKFNLDKLVRTAAATQRARTLKDKVNQSKASNNSSDKRATQEVNPSQLDITLDRIL